jgi:PAS domain S-box-containing protein
VRNKAASTIDGGQEDVELRSLPELLGERRDMRRLGFVERTNELDVMITRERDRIKQNKEKREGALLRQKMQGLTMSHRVKESKLEDELRDEEDALQEQFERDRQDLMAEHSLEYAKLIDYAAAKARGMAVSCGCDKPYLCRHTRHSVTDRRRPSKKLLQLQKNAARLRRAGRIKEAKEFESQGKEEDKKEESKWFKKYVESVVNVSSGKSKLQSLLEKQKDGLKMMEEKYRAKAVALTQNQDISKRNLKGTFRAERVKVVQFCRRAATQRDKRESERGDNLADMSEIQNVSKNFFQKGGADRDGELEDQPANWEAPKTWGLGNSERLCDTEGNMREDIHTLLGTGDVAGTFSRYSYSDDGSLARKKKDAVMLTELEGRLGAQQDAAMVSFAKSTWGMDAASSMRNLLRFGPSRQAFLAFLRVEFPDLDTDYKLEKFVSHPTQLLEARAPSELAESFYASYNKQGDDEDDAGFGERLTSLTLGSTAADSADNVIIQLLALGPYAAFLLSQECDDLMVWCNRNLGEDSSARSIQSLISASVKALPKTMEEWSNQFVSVADDLPIPLCLSDMTVSGAPMIYVNRAWEELTGFRSYEIVGRNCRFLQGELTDKHLVTHLSDSIRRGEECRVMLKNYTKRKDAFKNLVSVQPVLDSAGMYRFCIGTLQEKPKEPKDFDPKMVQLHSLVTLLSVLKRVDAVSGSEAMQRGAITPRMMVDGAVSRTTLGLTETSAVTTIEDVKSHHFGSLMEFTKIVWLAEPEKTLQKLLDDDLFIAAFKDFLALEYAEAEWELCVEARAIEGVRDMDEKGLRLAEFQRKFLSDTPATEGQDPRIIQIRVGTATRAAMNILSGDAFVRFVESRRCNVLLRRQQQAGSTAFVALDVEKASEIHHLIPDGDYWMSMFVAMAETFPACISVSDMTMPGAPMIFVNKEFERVTGYSKHEATGRSCRFLQGPETEKDCIALIGECMRRVEDCHVRLTNYKKDGSKFSNLLSIKPVLDRGGRYRYCIGVQFEVREDTRLKDRLHSLQRLLRMLPSKIDSMGAEEESDAQADEMRRKRARRDDMLLTAALHGNNSVGDRTTGRDLDLEEETKNAPVEVSANTKLGKRHRNALIMFKRTAWLDSALECLHAVLASHDGSALLRQFLHQAFSELDIKFWLASDTLGALTGREAANAAERILATFGAMPRVKKGREPRLENLEKGNTGLIRNEVVAVESEQTLKLMAFDTLVRFFLSPEGAKLVDLANRKGLAAISKSVERCIGLMPATADEWLHQFVCVADSIPVCLVISDMTIPGCPMLFVNREFELATGYTKAEATGRNCRFMQGDATEPESVAKLVSSLRHGHNCRVRITNYRKNGEPFLNLLSLTPVFDCNMLYRFCIAVQFELVDTLGVDRKLMELNKVLAFLPRQLDVPSSPDSVARGHKTARMLSGEAALDLFSGVHQLPKLSYDKVRRSHGAALIEFTKLHWLSNTSLYLRDLLADFPASQDALRDFLSETGDRTSVMLNLWCEVHGLKDMHPADLNDEASRIHRRYLATRGTERILGIHALHAVERGAEKALHVMAETCFPRFLEATHSTDFLRSISSQPDTPMRHAIDVGNVSQAVHVGDRNNVWLNMFVAMAENFPACITVSDVSLPGTTMVYVNREFERVTGYSKAEAIGRNCRFLSGADTEKDAVKFVSEAIRRAEDCHVKMTNYRHNGEKFQNLLSLKPVHDSSGAYCYMLGVQLEVTEGPELRNSLINIDRFLRMLPAKIDDGDQELSALAREYVSAGRELKLLESALTGHNSVGDVVDRNVVGKVFNLSSDREEEIKTLQAMEASLDARMGRINPSAVQRFKPNVWFSVASVALEYLWHVEAARDSFTEFLQQTFGDIHASLWKNVDGHLDAQRGGGGDGKYEHKNEGKEGGGGNVARAKAIAEGFSNFTWQSENFSKSSADRSGMGVDPVNHEGVDAAEMVRIAKMKKDGVVKFSLLSMDAFPKYLESAQFTNLMHAGDGGDPLWKEMVNALMKAVESLPHTAEDWLAQFATASEVVPFCITISDMTVPGCPLIFVNTTYERITGYSKTEAIGRNCRFMQGADTEKAARDTMATGLRNKQPCRTKITNYFRNGKKFQNLLSLKPICDSNGIYRYTVGVQLHLMNTTDMCNNIILMDEMVKLLPSTLEVPSSADATVSGRRLEDKRAEMNNHYICDTETLLDCHLGALRQFVKIVWLARPAVTIEKLVDVSPKVTTRFREFLKREYAEAHLDLVFCADRLRRIENEEFAAIEARNVAGKFFSEQKLLDSKSASHLVQSEAKKALNLLAVDCFPRFVDSADCDAVLDQDTFRDLNRHGLALDLASIADIEHLCDADDNWATMFMAMSENFPACITLSDMTIPGAPMIYVNKEFERVTQFPKREAVGQNCRFLQGPDTEMEDVALLGECLRRAEDCHVKLTNYRKGGQKFKNLLSMKPIFDADGQYRYCVGIQFEVCEDTGLKVRLNRLDRLLRMLPVEIVAGSEVDVPRGRAPKAEGGSAPSQKSRESKLLSAALQGNNSVGNDISTKEHDDDEEMSALKDFELNEDMLKLRVTKQLTKLNILTRPRESLNTLMATGVDMEMMFSRFLSGEFGAADFSFITKSKSACAMPPSSSRSAQLQELYAAATEDNAGASRANKSDSEIIDMLSERIDQRFDALAEDEFPRFVESPLFDELMDKIITSPGLRDKELMRKLQTTGCGKVIGDYTGSDFVEAVRISTQSYRAAFAIGDMMVPGIPIVCLNESYETTTGWGQESIGENSRYLQGPESEDDSKEAIADAFRSSEPVDVVITNHKKNGEIFTNKLAMRPIFDSKKKLVYYAGVLLEMRGSVEYRSQLDQYNRLLRIFPGVIPASSVKESSLFRQRVPDPVHEEKKKDYETYDASVSGSDDGSDRASGKFSSTMNEFATLIWLQAPEKALRQLLKIKNSREKFHSFLDTEYAGSNIDFWWDVEQLHKLPATQRHKRLMQLHQAYNLPAKGMVGGESKSEGNAMDRTQEAVVDGGETMYIEMREKATQVFDLLVKDFFPRFLESPFCKSLLDDIKENGDQHKYHIHNSLSGSADSENFSKYEQCAPWVRMFIQAAEEFPMCIVISDMTIPGAPMMFVNKEFCATTGYEKHEAEGRNCRFLQGPDTEPGAITLLGESLRRAQDCHVKITNYRKDGEEFQNLLSLRPIHDTNGVYRYSVGVQFEVLEGFDLNDRLKALDRLVRLLPHVIDMDDALGDVDGPLRPVLHSPVSAGKHTALVIASALKGKPYASGTAAQKEHMMGKLGGSESKDDDECPVVAFRFIKIMWVLDARNQLLKLFQSKEGADCFENFLSSRAAGHQLKFVQMVDKLAYLSPREREFQAADVWDSYSRRDTGSVAGRSVASGMGGGGNRGGRSEPASSLGGSYSGSGGDTDSDSDDSDDDRSTGSNASGSGLQAPVADGGEKTAFQKVVEARDRIMDRFVNELFPTFVESIFCSNLLKLRYGHDDSAGELASSRELRVTLRAYSTEHSDGKTELVDGKTKSYADYDQERADIAGENWLVMMEAVANDLEHALIVTDMTKPAAPIVYCNAAFNKLTGYGEHECLGRSCRFLQGPDTTAESIATLLRTMRNRTDCRVKMLNYKKSGEQFENLLSMVPVFDVDKNLRFYVGIQVDVTGALMLGTSVASSIDSFARLMPPVDGQMVSSASKSEGNAGGNEGDTVITDDLQRRAVFRHAAARGQLTKTTWADAATDSMRELLSLVSFQDNMMVFIQREYKCGLELQLILVMQKLQKSHKNADPDNLIEMYQKYISQDTTYRISPQDALQALEEHAETLLHMMVFDVFPRYLRQYKSFDDLRSSISMGTGAMFGSRVNLKKLQQCWQSLYKDTEDWVDLFAAVAENFEASVSITEVTIPNNPLIYVNREFVRLSGYTKSEIIGRNCRFLQGPESEMDKMRKLTHSIRHARDCHLEISNHRKNGELFRNLLSLKPVKDSEGLYRYVIGVQFEPDARYSDMRERLSVLHSFMKMLPSHLDVESPKEIKTLAQATKKVVDERSDSDVFIRVRRKRLVLSAQQNNGGGGARGGKKARPQSAGAVAPKIERTSAARLAMSMGSSTRSLRNKRGSPRTSSPGLVRQTYGSNQRRPRPQSAGGVMSRARQSAEGESPEVLSAARQRGGRGSTNALFTGMASPAPPANGSRRQRPGSAGSPRVRNAELREVKFQ